MAELRRALVGRRHLYAGFARVAACESLRWAGIIRILHIDQRNGHVGLTTVQRATRTWLVKTHTVDFEVHNPVSIEMAAYFRQFTFVPIGVVVFVLFHLAWQHDRDFFLVDFC